MHDLLNAFFLFFFPFNRKKNDFILIPETTTGDKNYKVNALAFLAIQLD